MKEENLIFLISQPRSGSTLLQKILGAHSKVYTRSEPWLMLHPSYSLKSDGLQAQYNRFNEKKAFNSFVKDLPNGITTYIHEMKEMYLKLYSYYLREEDECFLDKTPRYYLIIDELLKVFPKAKFILLIRNPLSVLGSIVNTWTKDNWSGLENYKYDLLNAIDVNIDLLERNLDKIHIISYEELINTENESLRKLISFLNLNYEPDILNYNKLDSEKWLYGDQDNVYKKKHIYKNNNKWQNSLDNPQYWRVINDYLNYIGKERFQKLGYKFEENLDILKRRMPLKSLNEVESGTFSLFSLLDNTKNKYLKEMHQTLAEKDDVIILKNTQLKEIQQILKDKNKLINARNNHIKKAQQLLKDKNDIIKARNKQIKVKQYALNKRDNVINLRNIRINEVQEVLKEKNDIINSRNKQIYVQRIQIKEIQVVLKEKNNVINLRNEQISNERKQIEKIQQRLMEKNDVINTRNIQIKTQKIQLQNKKKELSKFNIILNEIQLLSKISFIKSPLKKIKVYKNLLKIYMNY